MLAGPLTTEQIEVGRQNKVSRIVPCHPSCVKDGDWIVFIQSREAPGFAFRLFTFWSCLFTNSNKFRNC